MSKLSIISPRAVAAGLLTLAALAAPGLAAAQTTGTRLPGPATVVDGITVVGAIDDGSQGVRGEDPADATMADAPVIYEDEPVPPAEAAVQPDAAE